MIDRDDDVQAAGDDKRDLFDIVSGLAGLPAPSRPVDFRECAKTGDSFADYGYPIPYPPRPEDLA